MMMIGRGQVVQMEDDEEEDPSVFSCAWVYSRTVSDTSHTHPCGSTSSVSVDTFVRDEVSVRTEIARTG